MPPTPDRLAGWKQIAAYLGCSVRTAQRLESQYRLPVRRLQSVRGAIVMAYAHEIDHWREDGGGRAAQAELAAGLPAPTTIPHGTGRGLTGRVRYLVVACGLVVVSVVWVMARGVSDLRCEGPCTTSQGGTVVLSLGGREVNEHFTRWVRAPGGDVRSFGPLLAPDGQGRVTWGFTTDCATPPGSHDVRLIGERWGSSTRLLTIEVRRTGECSDDVADLVAENLLLDRSVGQPGEELGCRFTVRNQGATRAVRSVARLRLGLFADRTPVTDVALGDVDTPEIAVGASVTLEATIRIPADASPARSYYVWIVADNGSAVLERVSSNNFARSAPLLVQPRTDR